MWMFVKTVIVLLVALLVAFFQVKGDNCPFDGELTARRTPSITIFNQTLSEPFDRIFHSKPDGLECMWTIKSSDTDKIVRLNFTTFHMRNSSGSRTGDCVAVYDGDYHLSDSDHLIQQLCNRMPEPVYNSTGKYLTVVFRQGGHEGRRWMTMNYTMVSSTEPTAAASFLEVIKDKMLYIAIGVAAVIVIGLVFIRLRKRAMHKRRLLTTPSFEHHTSVIQGDQSECREDDGGSRRGSLIIHCSASVSSESERDFNETTSPETSFLNPRERETDASDHCSIRVETPSPLFPACVPSVPPVEPETAVHDEKSGPRGPPPSYDSVGS